jgi:hypothetical protein
MAFSKPSLDKSQSTIRWNKQVRTKHCAKGTCMEFTENKLTLLK